MEELREERRALVNTINENKFWEPIYAESFTARSESPREVCLEEVRKSHIYIGIFKDCYGHVPHNNNPEKVPATVLEYREAKKYKLQILIFIYKDATNRDRRLTKFLKDIGDFDKGHWRKEYSNIEELVRFILDALNRGTTESHIKMLKIKQEKEAQEIYSFPYFKRVKERIND